MDRIAAMQAFVRVVEAGTFSKAADSMGLPKPTVTRLVQSLETHLQTRLLHRTTRRVTVTPDGAAYYERATRVLGDIDELEASMTHAKVNPRGRLRIDVGSTIGRLVLIPALPDFHARYPDIQIDLGVSDRPVDLLSENVDAVLRGGDISDQSLVARRIAEFHFIAAASPAYLARYGTPEHPLDLDSADHRVVGFFSPRTGRPLSMDFSRDGERHEVYGRTTIAVNDSDAYVTAGLAGLGVIHTATFMLQDYVARGVLVPVLADWSSDPLPLHIVYPPNRHRSTKLRVFVDWVADLFANHDLMQRCSTLPWCCAMAKAAASGVPGLGPDAIPIEPPGIETALVARTP